MYACCICELSQAREAIIDTFMPELTYSTTALAPQLGAALIAGVTASLFSLPFDNMKTKLRK